ncbi:cytochrome c oxidase subunit II [Flavobacterium orientale]|uniref:Cytochrome c oxidase subunit 2 n=1 Tax=Flavobacterium orientale TaxID=1756020 RepID=A0A917DEK0_9FLAO|nr:cytochrome c oxidase subunit II [Flavobacterium orientale]GGD33798.1 cytochrome c oxidase subunit II [Flavobacterium orientale]
MTSLLVLVVIALVSIAIWQLTKIFDLTQVGSNVDNSQVANDNDNNVNGYLMFAFLIFIYLTTIFCVVEYGHFPLMSNSAAEHGAEVDRLMWISMILIFFVQTITQALLHYFSFKYRGKKGTTALYFADNNKLEMIWSIIPAITLAGLILYGLYAWTNIMFVDEENEDLLIVEVYAKQFGWEVRYAGDDNVLGKANVRYIEGINTLGVDAADPNAQDDIQANELHLPKGKKVMFKFRSQDVLHSAYMPHFRAQMNCVPGMVTQFAFTPNKTTEEMRNSKEMVEKVAEINRIRAEKSKALNAKGEEGLDPYTFDYLLLCNKICGSSHYNMQMKIVVSEPNEFKAWLKEKQTFGQVLKAQQQPVEVKQEVNDTLSTVVDTSSLAQVIR